MRCAANPLDASAVHPERYKLVERMAADAGCGVSDLLSDTEMRGKVHIEKYVDDTVGLPTLRDIMGELAKPGRDPRKEFEAFCFAEGVMTIDDLASGMKLPGIVTNVANFGAFVDIGVHQDGLVHVSELSDRFVSNPADVVKVGQKVQVSVLAVDKERKRISLSMKTVPGSGSSGNRNRERPAEGSAAQRPRGDFRHDGARDRGRGGYSGGNRGVRGGSGFSGGSSSGGFTLGDIWK